MEEEELIDVASLGDVLSMTACPFDGSDPSCPAGSFRVACATHRIEVATQAEILANDVCVPNSVRFELNGAPIGKMNTAASGQATRGPRGAILFYHAELRDEAGTDLVFWMDHTVGTTSVFDCDRFGGGPWSFRTTAIPADVALPSAWRGLPQRFFQYCGSPDPNERPDVITTKSLLIIDETEDRLHGIFDLVVEGRGPRAGETLRVYGDFGVDPIVR